jgi:uncharacterized protein YqhQ
MDGKGRAAVGQGDLHGIALAAMQSRYPPGYGAKAVFLGVVLDQATVPRRVRARRRYLGEFDVNYQRIPIENIESLQSAPVWRGDLQYRVQPLISQTPARTV